MAKLRVDKIAAPIIKDEYTGSVYFDGTGDYLSMSDSSDFDLGISNEPFTWELWFYKTAAAGTHCELGVLRGGGTAGWNATNGHQYRGFQYTDNKLYWQWWNGSTNINIISSLTPAINTWHHFAVSYDGTTTRAFLNGVIFGTSTEAYAKPSASNITRIGQDPSNSVTAHGYHSNVRICKGHAVYTENFTPPTRELEVHTGAKGVVFPAADNRTVLLACQDAYNPLTEATGRHTITGAGNLGGVPGQNLVTNGDFTDGTTGWTGLSGATLSVENGKLKITESTGAADGYAVNGTAITTVVGVTYKIEWTFTEGTNTSFQVRFGKSGNQTQEYQSNSAAGGTFNNGGTYSFYFTATGTQLNLSFIVNQASTYGYVSNVSVVAVAPISEANPGLLRKTNTTSTITETTGSVFFDGSGDYLSLAPSTDFSFSNDFTVEAWAYPTDITSDGSNSKYKAIFSLNVDGGWNAQGNGLVLSIGNLHYGVGYNTDYNNGIIPINTWTHLAVTRSDGAIKIFVNGILDQTINDSNSDDTFANGTGNIPAIGLFDKNGGTPRFYFTGYISNLRICKGHAVYKSQFIPPTRELEVHEGPDDDRTVLLCCYDAENIFADKTGRHVLAAYGDRTSSPTPTATDSPIGITTNNPGLIREVDPVEGPTFGGGVGFVSQNWLTLPKGTTTERYAGSNSANPAPRGLRASGQVAPNNAITNTVDSVEIATTGDALDFGDLITSKFGAGGIGSPTRGLFCGGGTPTRQSAIDYFTISTRGNGQDFGDITGSTRTLAGATGGNATRGLTFGGATAASTTNVICAITISTTGSATDFGDCTKQNGSAVVCSPTRAVSAGGDSAANGSNINSIDFVTIQSMGNAFDFGDLLDQSSGKGVSSITRGLFSNESTAGKRINYVTIATTGNAVDFGDLITNNASGGCASYSSLTRGCFAGLRTPSLTNTIEYFTISTLGDALDFGNLTQTVNNGGGCSNGHGGLG